jgi:hypothetical protein|tara:strand:- start:646 stop:1401 length:756 start_codon:yes stop_codon:yes gene_type:complete
MKKSEIIVTDTPNSKLNRIDTPEETNLVELCIRRGDSLEMVAKVMDLQDRATGRKAKEAYVTAMSGFKSEHLVISKNKEADFGSGRAKYKYATLDTICRVAVPVMSKWGLSHSWDTEQLNGSVKVTCILTHSLGHSEQVSLSAPPDAQNKNACQALGSTTQYLERYTFLAITGLSVGDGDTDAHTPAAKTLPESKTKEFIAKMLKCGTVTGADAVLAAASKECHKFNDLLSYKAIATQYNKTKTMLENPPE